ncbi:MAG: hypothetical protein ACYSR6_13870, partial [Planctomycetota bacterium]
MSHSRDHTLADEAGRAKRFLTPCRVCLIVLISVFLLFAAWLANFLMAERLVTIRYEDLENLSGPTNYDPNQNAAPLYREVVSQFGDAPEFLTERIKLAPADLGANDLAIIAQWLQENRVVLALAERAAWKPYCWTDDPDNLAPYTVAFEVAPLVDVARALRWRSLIEARNDNLLSSSRDIATCYRVGKHLEGPKVLVEQMASIVIKTIALDGAFTILCQAPDDPNLIHLLLKSFVQELHTSHKVIDWRYEKLFTELAIQSSFSDDGKGDGHLIPDGPFITYLEVFPGGRFVERKRFHLQPFLNYPLRIYQAAKAPGKKESLNLAQRCFDSLTMVAARTPWQGRDGANDVAEMCLKLSQNDFLNSVLAYDHFLSCVRKGHWVKAQQAGLLT